MIKNRVSKQWAAFRRKWIKDNPPDYKGDYICALCFLPVPLKEMHLDHIKNRSTNPELRLETTNVQPTHALCNLRKKTNV